MLFASWGAYRRALVSGHNAGRAQVLANQGDLQSGIEQTVQPSQFSTRSSGRNRGLDRLVVVPMAGHLDMPSDLYAAIFQ